MREMSKISHLDLLKMCRQVGGRNSAHRAVSGWTEETFFEEETTGLALVCYKHNIRNWTAIAFRGPNARTLNGMLSDVRATMATSVGVTPARYLEALRQVDVLREQRSVFTKVKDVITTKESNQLFLTGFYSGGDIAQWVLYESLKSVREEKGDSLECSNQKRTRSSFLGRQKNYCAVTFSNNGIYTLIPSCERDDAVAQMNSQCITYLSDPNFFNTSFGHIGEVRHVAFKPFAPTLISKLKYYLGHYTKCATVETLRVSFYTWVLQLSLRSVLGENSMLLNALNYFQSPFFFMMKYLGISKMLSEITAATNELFSVTSYPMMLTLIFTMGLIIYKYGSKLFNMFLTDTFNAPSHFLWQLKFRECGQLAEGDFQRMAHWPSSSQFFMSYPRYFVELLKPFSNVTPGIATFTIPEVLNDRQLERMPGYQPMPRLGNG